MKKLFGTDGIRGEAGTAPLDARTVASIGRAVAGHFRGKLGRNPRFVSGRDTRESGEWIERAFCEGASLAGAVCESAEVITTPGVAFLAVTEGFDAGIVISASHNPFRDNGIKIFTGSGKKLDEESERAVEAALGLSELEERASAGGGQAASRADEFRRAYADYLVGEFGDRSLGGMKIVIDCANGAASHIAPDLFRRLGAEVVSIHDAPDGRNINEGCGSLHMDVLRSKVLETGADIGVAFDGDADRALFVDEKGGLVDGDGVLWIMSKYLSEHGILAKPLIVATVMSNIGLELALKGKGIELLRADVGDRFVLEELLRTGAPIGGEQSGHVIFPHRSLVGDGMMTALYVLEAMHEQGKSVSALLEGFERYPQTLVNAKVGRKVPFAEVPEIAAAVADVERQIEGKGRLLLRYSGTENLARVMIEGQDQEAIETLASRLAGVIKEALT